MAVSLTFNSNSYDGRYIQVSLTETSASTSDNTSKISWKMTALGGNERRYDTHCKLVINGSTVYDQTYNWNAIDGFPTALNSSASGTTSAIAHNSDGSKSITISLTTYIYVHTDTTVSKTMTLSTIPRTSSIDSASSCNAGGTTTIKFTPKSTAFSYYINVTCPNASGTATSVVTKSKWTPGSTSQQNVNLTIPATVANYIPSKTSLTATATLTTYSGSTTVGTATKTFTVSVPNTSTFKPSVTSVALADTWSGKPSAFSSYYINGYSKIQATVQASGAYSSSIKSITFTLNGVSTTTDWNSDGTSGTLTAKITKSGSSYVTSQTASVTVTDSRGYTSAAKTQTVAIEHFGTPVLSPKLTLTDTGVQIAITYTVSSVNNNNTNTITVVQKKVSTSTTVTNTLTIPSASKYSGTVTYTSTTLSDLETETYEYTVTLKDLVNTVSTTLSTGVTLVSFLRGGKGVKFLGGDATAEGFYIYNTDFSITDSEYDTLADMLGIS